MTTLVSPGVDVQIINESFYSDSNVGTIPLIGIATRTNKLTPSGASVAQGTLASKAGALHLITSQKELLDTFGDPYFYSIQGTQQHGHELNEYGLLAAYQFLGQSKRAYIVRADLDMYELQPSSKAPRSSPEDKTIWFDVSNTKFGIFASTTNDVNPFTRQSAKVILDAANTNPTNGFPLDTYGSNGEYCIVVVEANNRIFEKISGKWYHIGSSSWKANKNLTYSSSVVVGVSFGSILKITDASGNAVTISFDAVANETQYSAASAVTKIMAAIDEAPALKGKIAFGLSANGKISLTWLQDSITLTNESGTPLANMFLTPGTYYGVKLTYSPHTNMPVGAAGSTGSVWIKTTKSGAGANYAIKTYNATTGQWTLPDSGIPFYSSTALATAGMSPIAGSMFIAYNEEGTASEPLASQSIMRYDGSSWQYCTYEVNSEAPSAPPEAGTYWYNTALRAEFMVNTGKQWVGYRNAYPNTDPLGIQLNSKKPTTQTDGTPLVDNDLWLDTSDLENYPKIYRYNGNTKRWYLIDNTDQSTPYSAIIFADARESSGPEYVGARTNYIRNSVSTADIVLSDYVDPDAPDPRTYPVGTLLMNTRFSTYNVKKWEPLWFKNGHFEEFTDYTDIDGYAIGDETVVFPALTDETVGRWVSASGNNLDGSPKMGRHAQRGMVVQALQSTFASNENIRSELIDFSLIACPGYPELIDEMLVLNADQKFVSFIIGDTPCRLLPSATAIQNWATNTANAATNGEKALLTRNEHIAVYYPWGLSTHPNGSEVMVPPSSMALVTYAYNDAIGQRWTAPAGYERGIVLNATSVGYLNAEGEYAPVILNQGQRDTMYLNSINPIAYIPKRGLVLYGQKTLASVQSALDRVNVVRLTNYLRTELDLIAKPFLFQVNDEHTREAFRKRVESFMIGLVGQRAVADFDVVCDQQNNTTERINRNQLWLDVIIIPEKSIEFIYIPCRIRSYGDSMEL